MDKKLKAFKIIFILSITFITSQTFENIITEKKLENNNHLNDSAQIFLEENKGDLIKDADDKNINEGNTKKNQGINNNINNIGNNQEENKIIINKEQLNSIEGFNGSKISDKNIKEKIFENNQKEKKENTEKNNININGIIINETVKTKEENNFGSNQNEKYNSTEKNLENKENTKIDENNKQIKEINEKISEENKNFTEHDFTDEEIEKIAENIDMFNDESEEGNQNINEIMNNSENIKDIEDIKGEEKKINKKLIKEYLYLFHNDLIKFLPFPYDYIFNLALGFIFMYILTSRKPKINKKIKLQNQDRVIATINKLLKDINNKLINYKENSKTNLNKKKLKIDFDINEQINKESINNINIKLNNILNDLIDRNKETSNERTLQDNICDLQMNILKSKILEDNNEEEEN